MNNDNKIHKANIAPPSLPREARLPINRCNLQPQILGSLTFQQHPVDLKIDGIQTLHKQLFDLLLEKPDRAGRAEQFMDYMAVQFRLHQLEDAGLMDIGGRGKADYLRLLRGWLFNPDGREAAVLKAWVESRFGLLARYHNGPLTDHQSNNYLGYAAARSEGLYGTNALESQLDLLYSYCQYELARQYKPDEHLHLYRGINRLENYEVLSQTDKRHAIVLLNNLNSFSGNEERASEFGDFLLEVDVPWQKILYYSSLFPGMHIGEDEYLVIGGVYQVQSRYW
jgi:NAD+--dinitrogen-reductase ADP-D-ribosyltransferase